MHEHHDHEFDAGYWEQHWQRVGQDHPGRVRREPNPRLVDVGAVLPPGRALDVGAGHGADALWLAGHGWRVTAVDVSAAALDRAAAEAAGSGTADRITWQQADLNDWCPPAGEFDLVTSHYVHGVEPKEKLWRRLADAVAPGGTLLVVGHDHSDTTPHVTHDEAPDAFSSAADAAGVLDPVQWRVVTAGPVARPTTDRDGHPVTAQDAVLHAVRTR